MHLIESRILQSTIHREWRTRNSIFKDYSICKVRRVNGIKITGGYKASPYAFVLATSFPSIIINFGISIEWGIELSGTP